MGPITPINIGQVGGSTSLRPANEAPQGSPTTGTAGLGGPSSSPTGNLQALSAMTGMVSQLLESVGGGVENDKLLRTLIALLIMFALLEQTQQENTGLAQSLDSLGGRAGDRSHYVGMFSSSTTISIEHTTTTFVSAMNSQAMASSGEPPLQNGGSIDVSA